MTEFIQGLELCRLFYEEAVRPILSDAFPGLRYSAARIGSGSDVLGFDTEMSTDHDWGPRLLLFLDDGMIRRVGEAIRDTLARRLPKEFRGYPTGYTPGEDGALKLEATGSAMIPHRVDVISVREFIGGFLGFDIRQEIEPADWLTFPEQKLLAITAGAVYHDEIGLQAVRDRFAYFPHDVWLYLLATGWNRIGQEEHLMGRAGFAGDELGSTLIGARLVRDIMRLAFLMERQYAPYPKWLGSAFRRLTCSRELEPVLMRALCRQTWQEREKEMAAAYEFAAVMHNRLGVTEPLPIVTKPFHGRPFRVIHLGSDFSGALIRQIRNSTVRRLADGRLLGGIDQISDNTDLLCGTKWRGTLRQLYE